MTLAALILAIASATLLRQPGAPAPAVSSVADDVSRFEQRLQQLNDNVGKLASVQTAMERTLAAVATSSANAPAQRTASAPEPPDAAKWMEDYAAMSEALHPWRTYAELSLTAAVQNGKGVATLKGMVPSEYVRRQVHDAINEHARNLQLDTTAVKVSHRYEIRAGDSLSSIATAVCGREAAWKTLWKANHDAIESADHLPLAASMRVECD